MNADDELLFECRTQGQNNVRQGEKETTEMQAREMGAVTWWSQVAWVSALVDHDLVTQGRTPTEARDALVEAVGLMVRWSLKDGGGPWDALDKHDTMPESVKAMAEFKRRFDEAVELPPIVFPSTVNANAYRFRVVVDPADLGAPTGQ